MSRSYTIVRVVIGALVLACLAGCESAPDCTFTGEGDKAYTAGCLVLHDNELLLVEAMGSKWGPPGGTVRPNESAQCGAERETWEETSVAVSAQELALAFDNGFHLYWCTPVGAPTPEVRAPLEIMSVGFFPPGDFAQLNWRYPDQGAVFYNMVKQKAGR